MYNAPSVIYPVGRCRFLAVLLLLLALAGLGLLIQWWTSESGSSPIQRWAGWAGAVLGLSWGLWAIRDWHRSPCGRLEWDAHAPAASLLPADGQGAWCWHEAGRMGATSVNSVELALDLQVLALLRMQGGAAIPRWAWVERWRAPAHWNDLRRALHSRGM